MQQLLEQVLAPPTTGPHVLSENSIKCLIHVLRLITSTIQVSWFSSINQYVNGQFFLMALKNISHALNSFFILHNQFNTLLLKVYSDLLFVLHKSGQINNYKYNPKYWKHNKIKYSQCTHHPCTNHSGFASGTLYLAPFISHTYIRLSNIVIINRPLV